MVSGFERQMRRRVFVSGCAAAAMIATAGLAVAQNQRKAPKIGVLFFGTPGHDVSDQARVFREGMQALGWVEGRTIHYELRFASGDQEKLAAFASELVVMRVAAIAAIGTAASQAASKATSTIPIVMVGVGDPIGAGLVSNLAQPGRNITGTSLMLRETQPKVLEILKEAIPGLKRVAILHVNERWIAHAQATASRLGIETHGIVIGSAEDLPRQLGSLAGVEALWVLADPYIDEMRSQIADLAIRHRLPSMGPFGLYAEAGFLFSYSANLGAMHGRAAYYVDRILRGARPGDLPIEQPAKFEMIVNLKTARSLGFTVPPALLVRADRVIE